jgi:hypothetical protein
MTDDDLSNQPEPLANEQVTAHEVPGSQQLRGFSDRANFVNDMVTILATDPAYTSTPVDPSTIIVPVTPTAAARPPVLTLTQIKLWLRIEASQTAEDTELKMMEMAARTYTETYLRQTLDPNRTDGGTPPVLLGVGENIQQAMLLLIAQWYRNRELMVSGRLAEPPFAYAALLSGVRDYPGVY